MDVVVVASGLVDWIGAAVDRRAVDDPLWLLDDPDTSLPDEVVHAVDALTCNQPAGEVPAADDVGGIVWVEEQVAGPAAGVVAVGVLWVGSQQVSPWRSCSPSGLVTVKR